MKKLIFILFVLLQFSLSWASCSLYGGGGQHDAIGTANCSGNPSGWIPATCTGLRNLSSNLFFGGCEECYGMCYSWGASIAGVNCLVCSSQCDLDSLQCVKNGNQWTTLGTATTCGGKGCRSCDTTMHCIAYPLPNNCVDIPASSQISCVNGQCSGLPGSRWFSSYEKNCTNECGSIERTTVTGDTVFMVGKTCNDNVACSPQTFCTDFDNGTYVLWKRCYVGNETVGNVDERGNYTQIEFSDNGRCAQNGYPSTNYPNSGNYASGSGGVTGGYGGEYGGGYGNGDDDDGLPSDCALYGVGCVPDTTDYSDPENQTPDKGCTCESWDGMNTVSIIKCKDGTQRTIFMSCKDWIAQQSGAGTPPSSSQSSGGGSSGSTSSSASTSSSDSNPFKGKYPEYPADQPTTNKNVQGALSGLITVVNDIKNKLVEIKNYLTGNTEESYNIESSTLEHGDYSDLDSLTMPKLSFDSLWSVIDTSQKIIDTSRYVGVGTCPIINGKFSTCKKIPFFRGNTELDMKFDFSNFWGFNLCTLIKTLVLAFSSIISTLISIKMFLHKGL